MILVKSQTGVGKTHSTAQVVAKHGKTIWLADRIADITPVVEAIEAAGGSVGRIETLTGCQPRGLPNCLHPEVIKRWQEKGYEYRSVFCYEKCIRQGESTECPFLASYDRLEMADSIVVTKALARAPGFFSNWGNAGRDTVVIDEDPIGLLRHPVTVTSSELRSLLKLLDEVISEFRKQARLAGIEEAQELSRVVDWCLRQIELRPIDSPAAVVLVPRNLGPPDAVDEIHLKRREEGRKLLRKSLQARMRSDPDGTIRNILRDLDNLVRRAADGLILVTDEGLTFHISTLIPMNKRVIVLDATAKPELLEPLFAPRPIRTYCDDRVEPSGRVIQFMDFNGPRSYLNKIPSPRKVVEILDALGDRHPTGKIVLISHKSHVDQLRQSSRHSGRIVIAHFGALRGRNDLMSGPSNPIACHVVVGSPKTTEAARQQLALAIHGQEILPFPPLENVVHVVESRVPRELITAENRDLKRIWEVCHKGYSEPRMQEVYQHTVAAELAQAADRARVLIQPATVYLLSNEYCPDLWFAEMCFAKEFLKLPTPYRSDFYANYRRFEARALEMLNSGQSITGASVCRVLGQVATWGKRYWTRFRDEHSEILEGDRKFRLKAE